MSVLVRIGCRKQHRSVFKQLTSSVARFEQDGHLALAKTSEEDLECHRLAVSVFLDVFVRWWKKLWKYMAPPYGRGLDSVELNAVDALGERIRGELPALLGGGSLAS